MADPAQHLQMLKLLLGVTDSKDDPLLNQILTGVTSRFEEYLDFPLAHGVDLVETYDAVGAQFLLKRIPVESVSQITYEGELVAADHYRWGATSGVVYWLNGSVPLESPQSIEVTYTAGYQVWPDDLSRAVVYQSAHEYRERDQMGKASISDGVGGSVTLVGFELLKDVRLTLDNHRRRVI